MDPETVRALFKALAKEGVEYILCGSCIATPEALYAMKRETIRLQDKAYPQKLKEKFGLKD